MPSLPDVLSRSVDFIAWGNFSDPGVMVLWLRSLVLLAVVVCTAWAAGQLACRAFRFRSAEQEFVLVGATGLAVLALLASLLALVGAYVWWAAAACGIALIAAGARGMARLPRVIWRVARGAPAATALAVLCSLPAVLPPYRWDEVAYHLAYPQQWVTAGHLTLDPHLPYPLYTLTWQALLGVALMLGSPSVAHLLTWFTGVLTAWCIGLFLEELNVGAAGVRVARLAFLVTPLVLSILDVALVDVPIMCFVTVSVYGLFTLRRDTVNQAGHVMPGALCAAALLGLKPTSVLYVPLLLGVAGYRLPWRTVAVYAAVLVVGGAAWYVRNFVLTGDPLTPLIANAVGHAAPYWSRADLAAQAADLERGLSYRPLDLLALPVRVLSSTDTGPLRGPPLLGYALLLPFSLLVASRFARQQALDVLVASWYVVGVWVGTTYHLRYAYWIPLGIVCAAVVSDSIAARWRSAPRWWAWAVPTVLLIGPTPAALRAIKNEFHERIPVTAAGRRAYAFGGSAGDTAAYGVVTRRADPGAVVYNVAPPLTYYWQEASLRVVDGMFHPSGLLEFDSALTRGRLAEFLRDAGADYLVLNDRYAAVLFGEPRDSIPARVTEALGPPVYRDSVQSVYTLAANRPTVRTSIGRVRPIADTRGP